LFDRQRILEEPEKVKDYSAPKGTYYSFGLDVGRLNDTSELVVTKVMPDKNGVSKKEVV
jgi:hypothetical protein